MSTTISASMDRHLALLNQFEDLKHHTWRKRSAPIPPNRPKPTVDAFTERIPGAWVSQRPYSHIPTLLIGGITAAIVGFGLAQGKTTSVVVVGTLLALGYEVLRSVPFYYFAHDVVDQDGFKQAKRDWRIEQDAHEEEVKKAREPADWLKTLEEFANADRSPDERALLRRELAHAGFETIQMDGFDSERCKQTLNAWKSGERPADTAIGLAARGYYEGSFADIKSALALARGEERIALAKELKARCFPGGRCVASFSDKREHGELYRVIHLATLPKAEKAAA